MKRNNLFHYKKSGLKEDLIGTRCTSCLCLLIMVTAVSAAGQSDSAKYLWNAGDFRFGDSFFRCDTPDTILIGNRELLTVGFTEGDTLFVIPRRSLSTYEDSGGMTIDPKSSTIQWTFPKSWEVIPDRYAYATLGIAPDEIQIAMHGNSENNRSICLYAPLINLVNIFPSDEGDLNNSGLQFIENFNYEQPNQFQRIPLTVFPDRPGYGVGLVRFLKLNPNYANMGALNDSVILIDIQLDTIFGAYGDTGSGYVKFIRGQILDTLKFDIDRTGAYRINNGTEVRPGAVETETLKIKYLLSSSEQFAGAIYIDQPTKFRIAQYIPGITADYGCLLTLTGDNDDFVILKGLCKTDSLIVRGNDGYKGYIQYLLYRNNSKTGHQKFSKDITFSPCKFEVFPTITNQLLQLRYTLAEKQHIALNLYDVTGRKVATLVEGTVEPGHYAYYVDSALLSQGVYFVSLRSEKEIKNKKIIVIK
ncbi:MAG: T9SS type A sorting domain-containing protein [candidate division WOR-3 bacterium]